MANVSQSTETPKLDAGGAEGCAYETRILDIYPNQDLINETYPRIYSAGKMLETLLLLGSNQTGVCLEQADFENLYSVQAELMQIIPTSSELHDMIGKGAYLDKRERDIKQVFEQHLGWVSSLLKTYNTISESVGEFAKDLNLIAAQIPETPAKGVFLDKLPMLKMLSQKTNELVNKISENLTYQTTRYNEHGLCGISAYIPPQTQI